MVAVVTAGAATAAAAAVSIPVASGTIIVTEPGVVMATTAAMALRLTSAQLAALGTASGLVAATASTISAVHGSDAKKMLALKKDLEDNYTCVSPGDSYTVQGSLSLVMTAHVIYDSLASASRDAV